jgi:hypothetical protein
VQQNNRTTNQPKGTEMKFIITWDNRPKFCFLVRTASGNAVAYFCNRKDAENFCKVAA